MDDTSKYLIHAAITANGVVERSDVVGAIFGQTEGLLGDELDLRDLQQSSKVGRIDVEVTSEGGQSFGEVTIASSLDRVQTAIIAAALETITRVGPCRARVEVTSIEDVREAKRREVVERAKELLADSFGESVMTSDEILEEVREAVRVENIGEYAGLPAGPRVEDSDAVIVVEGRADVLTLLKYGIKNAVAVEGTDVPDAVADLTRDRTVTAFLDGDRGGELILRELTQVGDVDYVAFAPENRSVEDLDRHEVMAALRAKVSLDRLPEEGDLRAVTDAGSDRDIPPRPPTSGTEATVADGPNGATAVTEAGGGEAGVPTVTDPPSAAETGGVTTDDGPAATGSPADSEGLTEGSPSGDGEAVDDGPRPPDDGGDESDGEASEEGMDGEASKEGMDGEASEEGTDGPAARSLADHVREVIDGDTGRARLLDDEFRTLDEDDAVDAFDAIERAERTPFAVVLDGELSQRVLDVAAQRGVDHVVARDTGEFVKRPVDVRVRTADQLASS